MAIIFIYMILASQFKSFLQPLALMTSLPLTLIGVVLALLMFRSTLSMFSIIGVVMLMGLVTKNAILLVDFAIRAREEHVMTRRRPCPAWPAPRPCCWRPRAAAPHPDDHAGHDLRHGAAGVCADRRLRAARAHGPGGDWRRDHLLAADAGGGAGGVLLHG
jgi:energy-converting hydrogenase Eha subunit E